MARTFDINHPIDHAVLLLNKKTGDKEGRILTYYGSRGGACHALVELYEGNSFDGEYHEGKGQAAGYGYDKESAAIAEALRMAKISTGDMPLKGDAAGHSGHLKPWVKEDREKIEAKAREQKAIPVYGSAGNQETAFSIYFRYVSAV